MINAVNPLWEYIESMKYTKYTWNCSVGNYTTQTISGQCIGLESCLLESSSLTDSVHFLFSFSFNQRGKIKELKFACV